MYEFANLILSLYLVVLAIWQDKFLHTNSVDDISCVFAHISSELAFRGYFNRRLLTKGINCYIVIYPKCSLTKETAYLKRVSTKD
jgi:hypothetical protein